MHNADSNRISVFLLKSGKSDPGQMNPQECILVAPECILVAEILSFMPVYG
jgi:hypothetical protein